MKQIILALMLAVAGIGVAVAANPIREGNMISGHVLVKGSEENIPYATVLIVGSGQGTVSNEEGQFEFKNLPAGKYTLRVSAVGYKTQEKAIEVNKDFTAVVHFQMEEESFMTDEVVVSANRNEVSRKAAPVVVNVMSAKLFEMVNSTDLAKTLNYQSGLRVENNCQNCGFPQVRINGLEGPYSQILINSRPVISALSGVYGLEQIPVNMIERVEVVRGGNKFDLQPHEADITEQTKHIINSGGLSYDLFWREYKHKISLYGSIQHTDRNSYYGAQKDMNAYGKTDDLTWVAGGMYVGNMNNCLFAPATFTGGLEYQNNSLHDVMTGYHRDMQQDVRIASAFVQNEWKMNVLTMLVGARLDKHNLIDKLIFSPRVNLLYKPTEDFQARLTYSTGFRAPQAYDEDLHVTAVGGEGVQIKLADNLREERSNSYSGSVDWTAHLGHWQANILVEGFYTDLRHVFVLEDIGKNDVGDVIKERRNGNGARVYGANLDAKIAHGKEAQLQLGFTAQRSRYTREEVWTQVDGKDLTTKRMPRTPDYYGYFTFSSAPLKNFDFSLSGTYTGKMIVPHYAGYIAEDRMETTPQFFDLNLKLNYTFVLHDHIKFQLNTGVQNIFNSFQKDLDKGEFRDAGYFYGPTQPRTFFIGFKIMN